MGFKLFLEKMLTFSRKAGNVMERKPKVKLPKQEPDKFISGAEKFRGIPDVEAYEYIKSDEGQGVIDRLRRLGKQVRAEIRENK